MLVVGIGYKKERGKDTLAKIIQEARGHKFRIVRYAFADALKQEVTDHVQRIWMSEYPDNLFGAQKAMQSTCSWAGVPFDPAPSLTDPHCPYGKQRALLQWWGTEYRRQQFGENYWVDLLADKIKKEHPQIALITDVRFPNEVNMVGSLHGVTICVERPNLTEDGDGHASENSLKPGDFDFIIEATSLNMLREFGLKQFDDICAR